MKVVIAGGSGFVGKYIVSLLVKHKIVPIILTRNKSSIINNIQYVQWNAYNKTVDTANLPLFDAAINLSGAGIADKRWSASRKDELFNSRIKTTNFLIEIIKQHSPQCATLINASAIGIYGADKENQSAGYTEENIHSSGFIEQLSKDWEAAALQASSSLRVVLLRIGIVLGKEGGAFPKFYNPLKLGIMPILGTGKQIISWIHVKDLAAQFIYALQNEKMQGAYNCVAPYPVSNRALMQTIAKVKGGIAIPAPTPSLVLKIVMGDMAADILKSTTVSAEKIIRSGYNFQFPSIEDAVTDIIQQ